MHFDRRWLWLGGMLAIAGAVHALDLTHFLSLQELQARREALASWRAAQPLGAALVFFAVYVVVAALSIPGALVLTIAAGAIFGLGWGTLIASFASSIGAFVAFFAARWLLRGWVRERFGARLAAMDAGIAKDGGYYLFTLRLVPTIPFVLINLAMGLTSIRPAVFYAISQVGMLPATLVYVNAGTQLAQIESLADILTPGLLGALLLVGLLPLAAHRIAAGAQARRVYAPWRRPARYDRNLVIIGAGSAGLVTAYIGATLRARVTLVEARQMGGDCLNNGCVPSKALIRSARFLSSVRRAREFGMRGAHAEFDFAEVMARVERVIQAVAPHDSVQRYTELGVDVVSGQARIVTPWEVEIARHDGRVQRLTTRSIVIAAGARPFVPPIAGLDQIEILTSENVWSLRELPRRLLVLGGGPIGCELAQCFARLGAQVTLVELLPRLLPREDADVSALVAQRFADEGIDVRTGHAAQRIEGVAGAKQLVAAYEGTEVRIPFDALLVAVGRTSNLQGYGLEELGVRVGRTVEVNGFLQTNFPNIYAAGDVAGPYQFTHAAAHQAWYAAINALLDPLWKFRADYRVMPAVTFVEPEVARVGLNEREAQERGIAHETTVYALDDLDRAIADSEAHGFVKVLTVPGKDRILGATIVGAHAGDLLAEFVLAMKHDIGLSKILGTIHAYPTMAEANKYAAGAWKRAHAPAQLLAWAQRYHAWRRAAGRSA